MIKNRISKTAVTALCIILILAYASVMLLPYTHECAGTDCAICAVIKTSSLLLLGLALSAALCQLANFSFSFSNVQNHIVSSRDTTPIGLKVKLSN